MADLTFYDSKDPRQRTRMLRLHLEGPDARRGSLYEAERESPDEVWPALRLVGHGYSLASVVERARVAGFVPSDDPPDRPQLAKRERDLRAALDRRRSVLEERLERWDTRRDADRTRGEVAALRWALRLIDACAELELLTDLRDRGYDV